MIFNAINLKNQIMSKRKYFDKNLDKMKLERWSNYYDGY